MNSRISHRLVSAACVLLILYAPSVFSQPSSPVAESQTYSEQNLEALTEQMLSKMQLDDPLLRFAYLRAMGLGGERLPDWVGIVFQDIRRRGNKTVPILLSLFQENRGFRDGLMVEIDSFGLSQADIEPILKAARSLALEEGRKLPITTTCGIAGLLKKHGTAADIRILEQLDYDPRTGDGTPIEGYIRMLKERLAKEEKQRK